MIANADGFFTLGYNYSLFLDPKTHRFVFIPGDQELSFANFAMMGSADQLMDMSLARPYGGENRLADRLLAIKEVREAHQEILKELSTTVFREDRLLADAAAIEGATKAISRGRRRRGLSGPNRPSASAPRGLRRPPTCGRSPRRGPPRSPIRSRGGRTATARSSTSGLRAGTRLQGRSTTRRSARSSRPRPGSRSASSRPRRRSVPGDPVGGPGRRGLRCRDEQGSLGRTPGGGRVVGASTPTATARPTA